MLIRKLRSKYLDNNPAFAFQGPMTLTADDTTNLLKNNFITNDKSKKVAQISSSIDYGTAPAHQRKSSMRIGGRNAHASQRLTAIQ